jgi:hypothetical protein
VIAPVASGRRYFAKDAGMGKRGEQVPARFGSADISCFTLRRDNIHVNKT